jgi:hypothetical protein
MSSPALLPCEALQKASGGTDLLDYQSGAGPRRLDLEPALRLRRVRFNARRDQSRHALEA